NQATNYAGAVYLSNCQSVVTESNFRSNSTVGLQGVALYAEHCDLILSHNIFSLNQAINPFAPIESIVFVGDNSFTTIDHCNFYDNGGWVENIILYVSSLSTVTLQNSIFSDHPYGINIYFETGSNTSVSYNDFYNSFINFSGSVPTGLGIISDVNTNGDPCDTFYNVFLDPLYIDPANGDFHLTEESPCIDAGDPASPLDPDGTIADMGAFYFHQATPLDPPQNVTIEISAGEVTLSWDAVTGANSYKVYSSDDPYSGFIEDSSGSFDGESWSAPIGDEKRYYHVIASTEVVR
ncbi:DUF5123 domain-containing protein, partial [bacterium]|nr:DUF5123 domain-containing protein [bacterium]